MTVHEKRSGLAAGALCSFLAAGRVGCDENKPEPPPPLVAAEHPEFFVRWRCDEPLALTFDLNGEPPASLEPAQIEAVIRALKTWCQREGISLERTAP